MTNKKISALTSATTPLAGTEVLPIVQSSATTQVTVANLTAGRITSMSQLTVTGTGDNGIGTSSPKSQVDIYKATTGGVLRISSNADAAYGSLIFSSNNNTYLTYGASISSFGDGGGVDSGALLFNTGQGSARAEVMRLNGVGELQVQTAAIVVYAPTPAAISAAATLTNANLKTQIISATGTTYTITMPLGTTMETLCQWSAVNLGFNFSVINTATGIITMAVNTGVTSLGALTIAIGASAQFRIRRTAGNTFILYRLS
jgi:hypothetical protein